MRNNHLILGTPANVMLGYLCKKVENELYTLWE